MFASLGSYVGLAYLYGKTSLQAAGAITGSLARSETLETALGSASRAALMAVIVLGPTRRRVRKRERRDRATGAVSGAQT